MRVLIVVPARYGSTRFPGKPLAPIAGRAMIERVAARARHAAETLKGAGVDAEYAAATDDARIAEHCAAAGIRAVVTSRDIPSGSDRALAAAEVRDAAPDIVVNLQGDAPFTPIGHIVDLVSALRVDETADVATPCIQLDWAGLDALRRAKETTPFSGTTCLMGADGRALWFSKSILPAMRAEKTLRTQSPLSPVYRHVGIYAFRLAALRRFTALPPSHYEQLEGLEQLRLLEAGVAIRCVPVAPGAVSTSGVDAPADIERLEAMIAEHGDPDAAYFEG